MKKSNNKGFSLVELIIVIAIMVVLIGVLAPLFIRYVEKSKQGADIDALASCITVMQAYYADKPAAVVTIKVTDGHFTTDITAASTELADAGCTEYTIKGKWDTGLQAVYTTSTGAIAYTGESDYYKASTTGYDAK